MHAQKNKKVYVIFKIPKTKKPASGGGIFQKVVVKGTNRAELNSILLALRKNNPLNKYWIEIRTENRPALEWNCRQKLR